MKKFFLVIFAAVFLSAGPVFALGVDDMGGDRDSACSSPQVKEGHLCRMDKATLVKLKAVPPVSKSADPSLKKIRKGEKMRIGVGIEQ